MTKTEIKAELRRSACLDEDPYQTLLSAAWIRASSFREHGQTVASLRNYAMRMFFLFVAEAL